jgi:DNA-binding CsgD family transcriptional regulator
MLDHPSFAPSNTRSLPSCPMHPGSPVRSYRSHGPRGAGLYPQCVPRGVERPHLLMWPRDQPTAWEGQRSAPSPSELEVLRDAAAGLTTSECAFKRIKGAQTVKTQRKSILLKLDARDIAQAVGIAFSRQIITSERAE